MMIKRLFVLLIFFIPLVALANTVPQWQIVPSESHLTFTGTQNGAPTTGEFKKFTGEINFDPDQLGASNVTITVDMASVYTSYNQILDTLKTSDWFNIQAFPQAIFKSTSFTKTGVKVLMPNSERFSVVVAENPTVGLSVIGLVPALVSFTFNMMGFETPCSVSVPNTFAASFPVSSTLLLTNVAMGYFATSKKSASLRCLSNSGIPVMTSATLIVTLPLLGTSVYSLAPFN